MSYFNSLNKQLYGGWAPGKFVPSNLTVLPDTEDAKAKLGEAIYEMSLGTKLKDRDQMNRYLEYKKKYFALPENDRKIANSVAARAKNALLRKYNIRKPKKPRSFSQKRLAWNQWLGAERNNPLAYAPMFDNYDNYDLYKSRVGRNNAEILNAARKRMNEEIEAIRVSDPTLNEQTARIQYKINKLDELEDVKNAIKRKQKNIIDGGDDTGMEETSTTTPPTKKNKF